MNLKQTRKLMTLKLDASWRPIEIIPAEKGFSMVYTGRAQPVENYTHGPCARFLFPSVIVLNNYIRNGQINMSPTRKNIYWRYLIEDLYNKSKLYRID